MKFLIYVDVVTMYVYFVEILIYSTKIPDYIIIK